MAPEKNGIPSFLVSANSLLMVSRAMKLGPELNHTHKVGFPPPQVQVLDPLIRAQFHKACKHKYLLRTNKICSAKLDFPLDYSTVTATCSPDHFLISQETC